MKISELSFRPLTTNDKSISAFTKDGKSKYFIMYVNQDHYRVYGIDGINDGGTEFEIDLDSVKKLVYDDWVEVVKGYLD